MIHNELPTLDNLAIRKPHLYKSESKCRVCNREIETREHLFTCIEMEQFTREVWNTTVKKLVKRIEEEEECP